ncbi:MAG: nucleotidyltransferase domain-containing protein [Sphingobacteriaceae bacterium]|nr:nucleotidyltransferase domain-containing protein [Sphingobacteriaceae bacterium]
MIVHKPLNIIFSAYSNIVVIRELRHTRNGFSGREIAKRGGLSAPAAINALTHLESLKIINRRIGGRDHLFTLNFSNYFVKKVLLPVLDAESQYFDLIVLKLKKILSKEAISVILYGSVARKEETVKSDVDICIVYPNLKNKSVLEKKIDICRDELYKNYGITLAPFNISLKEFQKRARLKKSPINDIIKEGIVLSGKSIKRLINGN